MHSETQKYWQLTIKRTIACLKFIAPLAITGVISAYASSAFSSPAERLGQWNWSGVDRVVVIPDIHGAYSEFTELLKTSGVVDSSLQWIAGDTHLVSLGDLLDRGAESRDVMDLLMRLQEEARESDGRVHVVAGNHETMNLLGDLRYVSAGEFAAYSDIESADQRQQAYRVFLGQRNKAVALDFLEGGVNAAERNPKLRQVFEDLYPPGYFGHRSAFAPDGRYGRWLLSLPAMIVINRTVFVHGGLPAITATAPIDELNERYHAELSRFFVSWRQLTDVGILNQDGIQTDRELISKALRIANPSTCPRSERAVCARERGRAKKRQRKPTHEDLATLKELGDVNSFPMLGATGPLWYRGSVRCKNILEMPVMLAALTNLGAERVVVGHTPTRDRRVHRLRDDRLIMLDTGMLVSRYKGRPAALIMEQDNLQVQYLNPVERTPPLGEGGYGTNPLSKDQLHEALRHGDIVGIKKGWFDISWNIELAYQGTKLEAVFFPKDERGADKRELAAYRINELLGFDLVPATAAREIDGKAGTLQLEHRHLLTESQRRQEEIQVTGSCPISTQRHLLTVYDLLVGINRSRTSMGYDRSHWDLQAWGHDKAFSLKHSLPASAKKQKFELPAAVWDSLSLLDETKLTEAVGQQLNTEQIEALLARRDAILHIMRHRGGSYGPRGKAAKGNRHQ